MSTWTIAREDNLIVVLHRNEFNCEVCCGRVGNDLAEVVEWIVLKASARSGDRIVLPDGGLLFVAGCGAVG